jgi:hypothetical protein
MVGLHSGTHSRAIVILLELGVYSDLSVGTDLIRP